MRKTVLKLLSLCMVCALLLCACGEAATNNSPASQTQQSNNATNNNSPVTNNMQPADVPTVSGTSDETLRVVIAAEPTLIIPGTGRHADATRLILDCIFDKLIVRDPDTGELKPNAATAWEWIDDTHLKLTIRDDLVAHDGTPCNAYDVLYTYQIGTSMGTSHWKRIDINECYVEDETHIVIGTKEVFPMLPDSMSFYYCGPVIDESSVEALGGIDAATRNGKCGTGPYYVEEWVEGSHITLTRNENYWGELPYYKNIVFTFVSDSASRAMAIQSGDVDVATALTYTDTMGLVGNSAIDMIYGTSTCVKTLWMNTLIEPFGDERVREAVDLLIDKDAINAMATGQHGQVVDSVFAISTPLYSGGTEKHEVNIERAKELLAEAGYADGFTTEMYGTSETRAVMEMIQSCLLKANIQTNITTVDGSTEVTKMNEGDYILHCGFAYNYDQYSLLDRFDGRLEISKSGGGSHYQSEEIYEMIDRCRAAIDLAEQQQAFAVLQDFIRAHYVVIPLYTEVGYQAVRAGITGGNFNDLGYINLTTIRPVA